ncbi:MAG: nonstructural protein [Microvirus sp.]|nr:MAG: nonstructural protein [Microvirus sp.]
MMLKAYSIFDIKALQYHAPFFTHTDGSAVRMFSDVVNDMNTNIGRHPADYQLFFVGTFSDADGSLERALPIAHVIDAVALLRIAPTGDLFKNSAEHTLGEFAAKNGAAK